MPPSPTEQSHSIINGVLWRPRCGTPWRDVQPKYGSLSNIYRRFLVSSDTGIWEAVAVTLAEILADTGHYGTDSTTVRAHVLAAGGKWELIDALLAARGFTNKLHCLADALGRPLAFHLTIGEAADCKAYDA